MVLLTREQVREVDRLAVEELEIPGLVLMENAAIGATAAAERWLREGGGSAALILCGGGNNGGDGYAIARHLHNGGVKVRIEAMKPLDDLEGDAATNARICRNMGLAIDVLTGEADVRRASERWAEADLAVDALLGTGFAQARVREPMATAIHQLNELDRPRVLAVDVPSGLDCDTGEPADAAVRADGTATFVAGKVGFGRARAYTGRVEVVSIGSPPALIERARTTNPVERPPSPGPS